MTEPGKELSPNRKTPLWYRSAFLVGQGVAVSRAAELLGCDRGTITNYKKDPEWVAEYERWTEVAVRDLAPVVDRLKVAGLSAASVALAGQLSIADGTDPALRELLEAAEPSGAPIYSVRLKALEMRRQAQIDLLNMTIVKAALGPVIGEREGALAQQVMEIHIHGDEVVFDAVDAAASDVEEVEE